MTSNTPHPTSRRITDESRATLLGTAIVLVMGALVIAGGLILAVAAVVLGDTALQLP